MDIHIITAGVSHHILRIVDGKPVIVPPPDKAVATTPAA